MGSVLRTKFVLRLGSLLDLVFLRRTFPCHAQLGLGNFARQRNVKAHARAMPVRVAGNSAAGVTHFRSVVGNGITLGDFEPWNVADVLSPQPGLWSLSNGARYSAGRPIPRSQSLAKTIAFESSSHAGEKLLQFPPVTGIDGPPPTRRTQICFDPRVRPVYTIHFPSGETSESVVSVRAGGDCGTNFLVDRSNSMIFEVRPATSSNWIGPSGQRAMG